LIIKWCYYVNDEVDPKKNNYWYIVLIFFHFIENDIWNFGVIMLGEQWWWGNYHIHHIVLSAFKNVMMGKLKLACNKILFTN